MKIIKEAQPADIQVCEMKDGQIGVITQWNNDPEHIGAIVQRYGEQCLVKLGHTKGSGWNTLPNLVNHSDLRVRILPPGTVIEL